MSVPQVQVLPPQAGGQLPLGLAIPGLTALSNGVTNPVPNTGDTTQTNIAGWAEAETNDKSFVAYIIAWGIFLLLIALLNRTRAGHTVIYYLLVLALVLLLVVNYAAITNLLAPITEGDTGAVGPSETSSGPSGENYNVTVLPQALPGSVIQITTGGAGSPRINFGQA